ncbi:hypothetical protein ACP275_09G082000 [Erythranthe tilingii]
MAAYAALLSLKHIIEQIQLHPRPPISLHQNQVDSLTDALNFLQDFLEGYSCSSSSKEAEDVLESRIAEAAHAAEDLIETRVVDQIVGGEKIRSSDFHQDLEKVIQDMGFIKKDVMEIKDNNIGIEDHLHINSSTLDGAGSSSSPSTRQNAMVGFDDLLIQVMDKLTGGQSNLQILPIVGMGGIGKTTLARNAYLKPLIKHHFDICAWVTISQNYNVQEILIKILLCISKAGSRETLSAKREDELGERIHKSLWGRRYLIVMDDIWSVEVWDRVQIFFPDNGKESRIMITTRLSDVALIGSRGLVMDFLDENKSWDLLCRCVFEKKIDCPVELEEIGKTIAKKCKGLPLSIVVIGGLLAKSKPAREHWEYISENINSIANLADNERCLKVLQLSYNQLPLYLKPCFLYMGVFPEDSDILVSWLLKLWVSEGFVKPISGKSLEVVSREYLDDLCDRNLILVRKRGSNGKLKFCNIHDLLREVCLREAEKEKFIYVTRPHNLYIPQGINTQRRISIHQSLSEKEYLHQVLQALQYVPLARSLIVESQGVLPPLNYFRLLRVLTVPDKYFYPDEENRQGITLEDVFQLVNLRFLAVASGRHQNPWRFPSSVYLLWNLQTLIVNCTIGVVAPSEIWKMTQLRHVEFDELDLPDPPLSGQDDEFVLSNLHTLRRIRNFKCGEEMLKRIPNIKKLQICYGEEIEGCISSYCLNNLGRLRKLESLHCSFLLENGLQWNDLLQNLILPNSLRKLTFLGAKLRWEDITTKIGSLPHLQVLKLEACNMIGTEWETVEGKFCDLRLLQIFKCSDLEWWTTDSSHFPRLEKLVLQYMGNLTEIPLCIGEIPTLQLIYLENCSDSAVVSAKTILEEQEDLDNVGLRVKVYLLPNNQLRSLASPNFEVETW